MEIVESYIEYALQNKKLFVGLGIISENSRNLWKKSQDRGMVVNMIGKDLRGRKIRYIPRKRVNQLVSSLERQSGEKMIF